MKKFILALAALCMTTAAYGQRDNYDRWDNNGRNAEQIAQNTAQTAQRLSDLINRTANRGNYAGYQAAEVAQLAYQISNSLRYNDPRDRNNRNGSVKRMARLLSNKVANLDNAVRRDRILSNNFRVINMVQRLQQQSSNLERALNRNGNGGGNGGGHPYPRPQFRCVAVDQGWEEHRGGHTGFGPSQFAAERQALQICSRIHGTCRIAQCSNAN